jgi:hypothetical protein
MLWALHVYHADRARKTGRTMADEQQGEKPTEGGENPQVQQQGETPDAAKLQAQLAQVQDALKKVNREAAERRKKLDEYEAAEAARKEADLSETEKMSKRLAEAERKAQEAEQRAQAASVAVLRRDIAAKLNVPALLADRLRGETPEDIEADAKLLLAGLPKAGTPPGNAGSGAKQQGATSGKSMNDFIRAAAGRSQ